MQSKKVNSRSNVKIYQVTTTATTTTTTTTTTLFFTKQVRNFDQTEIDE